MKIIERYRDEFIAYLTADHGNQLSITIFCKSLYAFVLLKIFFMWPVFHDLAAENKFGFTSSNLTIFLWIGIVALVVGLVLRVNYILSSLIFIFSFVMSRLALPVINGSDLVLNLFLFLSIFLSVSPGAKDQSVKEFQQILYNGSFLLCRVQLSLIYLLSGFDKLSSDAWRTGSAVYSIVNLEFFFNPNVSPSLPEWAYVVTGWGTILFELSFAVLIWEKRFRNTLLAVGVIFHLGIMFVLSLPDFGLVMILLYTLFIPFERLRNKFKPVTSGDN